MINLVDFFNNTQYVLPLRKDPQKFSKQVAYQLYKTWERSILLSQQDNNASETHDGDPLFHMRKGTLAVKLPVHGTSWVLVLLWIWRCNTQDGFLQYMYHSTDYTFSQHCQAHLLGIFSLPHCFCLPSHFASSQHFFPLE